VLRDIYLSPEMSETGRTVPDMNEPPSRYDVTLTVERDGNSRPDPAAFTEAANRAAWSRYASIISAHLADRIINIVAVIAPNRYAAVAVARAVVSDALKRQAPSSIRPAGPPRPTAAVNFGVPPGSAEPPPWPLPGHTAGGVALEAVSVPPKCTYRTGPRLSPRTCCGLSAPPSYLDGLTGILLP
jgi:hypothetical protein